MVIGPDDGDVIFDGPGRRVVLKLHREDLSLTVNRYGPGERGPEPHVHRRHTDAFWVFAGELAFTVGPDDLPVRVAAGSGVAVPRHVIHSFRNDSDADARFVNVHAPDAGFAVYMRGRRDARDESERAAVLDAFDQFDPPADGGLRASEALHGPGLIETEFVRLASTDLPAGGELALAPRPTCLYVLAGAVEIDGTGASSGALAVVEGAAPLRAAGGDARLLLVSPGA